MAKEMVYTGTKSAPHRPFVPDSGLVEAVNIALILGRPLLLEGEPGCGKSSVAFSIAHELELPIFRWDIRSTSKARDGLYTYTPPLMLDKPLAEDPESIGNYIHFGPIGQAFLSKERAVILIDEVDKADADFSDDLLAEIDEARFYIPEAQFEVRAAYRPIFVVTNNQSKYVLSDGFLRACIFHYVQFPAAEHLRAIAMSHLAYEESLELELMERSLHYFLELRYKIAELTPNYRPSVREFLDWLRLLSLDPEKSIEQLQSRDFIPYHQVLLKFGAYNYMDVLFSDSLSETSPKISLTLIRKEMLNSFSEDEFRTLCSDVDHRFDKLPGESLEGKMRELISFLERQNRLEKLFEILSTERPKIDWRNLPS